MKDFYNIYNDHETKYRKKRNKKRVKKADHKHTYKECLFFVNKCGDYHRGSYCTICNKIGDMKLLESISIGNGFSRILKNSEILSKYNDYEIINIEDLFQKYITKKEPI